MSGSTSIQYPLLYKPPNWLLKKIDSSEVEYTSIIKNTQRLRDMLTDSATNWSDDVPRAFIQNCITGDIIINPNGLTGDKQFLDEHLSNERKGLREAGLLGIALLRDQDELAQSLIRSGWNKSVHHIQDLFHYAMQHGSLDTAKSIYTLLDAKSAILALHSNKNAYKGGGTPLFASAAKANDMGSILPKIDWLVGHGLDPHIYQNNNSDCIRDPILVCLDRCWRDVEKHTPIILQMLRRGYLGVELEVHYKSMAIERIKFYVFKEKKAMESLSFAVENEQAIKPFLMYLDAVNIRYAHLIPELFSDHPYTPFFPEETMPLPGSVSPTFQNLTSENICQFASTYSLDKRLDIVFSRQYWQGGEATLYALYDSLPKSLHRRIPSWVKRTLPIGSILHARETRQNAPLADWAARIENDTRAPAEAVAVGGG